MIKSFLTNWRYYIIFALGAVVIMTLFSEPLEKDIWEWLKAFFVTKAIAFACIGILYLLCSHWYNNGSIPEIDKICNED